MSAENDLKRRIFGLLITPVLFFVLCLSLFHMVNQISASEGEENEEDKEYTLYLDDRDTTYYDRSNLPADIDIVTPGQEEDNDGEVRPATCVDLMGEGGRNTPKWICPDPITIQNPDGKRQDSLDELNDMLVSFNTHITDEFQCDGATSETRTCPNNKAKLKVDFGFGLMPKVAYCCEPEINETSDNGSTGSEPTPEPSEDPDDEENNSPTNTPVPTEQAEDDISPTNRPTPIPRIKNGYDCKGEYGRAMAEAESEFVGKSRTYKQYYCDAEDQCVRIVGGDEYTCYQRTDDSSSDDEENGVRKVNASEVPSCSSLQDREDDDSFLSYVLVRTAMEQDQDCDEGKAASILDSIIETLQSI